MNTWLETNFDPWAYAVAGLSLALFVWSLCSIYQDIARRFREDAGEIINVESSSLIFRIMANFARPLAQLVRPWGENAEKRFAETGEQSFLLVSRRRIAQDLQAAGSPEGINADHYMGLVILSLFVFTVMGCFGYLCYPSTAVILPFSVCGLLVPRFWLTDLVKSRRKSIRKTLPYALDLLTLAVEAGLDFTTALARISDRLVGTPLGSELKVLLQEIQMGKIRADALRDMADRVSVYELSSVVSALVQTDELGAPLGPVLRIQAEFIRVRRAQEAEEMAMKAPVKLLFPLILFIFPTAFIMLFGPLALKYIFQL
jgi:tight adherence protein C